jgi:hypothetical protein
MYKEEKENKNKKIMYNCVKQHQLEVLIKVDQPKIALEEVQKRGDQQLMNMVMLVDQLIVIKL